jgi:hypothetical protein
MRKRDIAIAIATTGAVAGLVPVSAYAAPGSGNANPSCAALLAHAAKDYGPLGQLKQEVSRGLWAEIAQHKVNGEYFGYCIG